MIGTLREGHLVPMSTPATRLRCIGRVDLDHLPASTFRLARQLSKERRPGSVTDRFRQTMVVNHALHFQIFDTNNAKVVDHTAALLVGEVLSTPGDTLMHTSNRMAMFAPFWRTLRQPGMLPLDFGKRLLFGTKEARIFYFLSIRERSKRLESNINAYGGRGLRQVVRFYLARKGGVPFADAALVDGEGFDLATDRTMVDHLESADLREAHPVVMGDAKARLREGEASIAVLAPETWVSRFFSGLASAEERFKSQVDAYCDILKDLRMHAFQGGTLVLQDRKGFLLLIERKGLALLLPGITPLFQQVIIQPTTLFKRRFQGFDLLFIGKESILKGFTHIQTLAHNRTGIKRQRCHPTQAALKGTRLISLGLKPQGYQARFGKM